MHAPPDPSGRAVGLDRRAVRLRLASRLYTYLLASRTPATTAWSYPLENVALQAERLLTLRRRLLLCQSRQLPHARSQTLIELQQAIQRFPSELESLARAFPPEGVFPDLRELVAEVDHLCEEFPQARYDPQTRTLSVTTDPITLREIDLGSFRVELLLNRIGRYPRHDTYRILALSPNTAASNDAVTHPHVSDEHLCEGDAASPLHAALSEGRLADFFTLVQCVLTTYNPGSPYVALENWSGQPCHECGVTINDDERNGCSGCDHDFCSECISFCRTCSEYRCLNCVSDCAACEEPTCDRCMCSCEKCGKACCRSCLDEDLCPSCLESNDDNEPSEGDSENDPAPASPTIPIPRLNVTPPSSPSESTPESDTANPDGIHPAIEPQSSPGLDVDGSPGSQPPSHEQGPTEQGPAEWGSTEQGTAEQGPLEQRPASIDRAA